MWKIAVALGSGTEKAREVSPGKDKGKGVLRLMVPACPLKHKVSVLFFVVAEGS